ncbi:class I SAM-dependent methyltransferase [Mycobacterium sp. 94-17]|uniref:class I SAM-dependent methyltransferase n=1 Tax=Mycobacterium sp. 94-17 TaxID=2986147 RepID=UPI002D1EED15|nr:class I SAM-dependent methyltransferase [Mycobacterium sp. 94-17]MEB4212094.1 class I SAM-dependent methyltransferase [Mycobacterium sp. 94-17]
MSKAAPVLGQVQETLLIPLYARARDAALRHPVLGDQRARELVDALDYDFTRFGGPSLPGTVLRSAVLDGWVRRFLNQHPAATVVELGTGLNTRFDRLDNGSVRWFDLDLPDTIALRRRFFADRPRCAMVEGSVLDTDWFDTVAAAPGPYLFLSEAVLVYLTEAQVRTVLSQLAQRFAGSLLAFDTVGAVMLRTQQRNGSMHAVTARMQWACEDPRRLEAWGTRLLETRTLASPQADVARSWPARYRYGLPLLARLLPVVNSYKFNLFTLAPRSG